MSSGGEWRFRRKDDMVARELRPGVIGAALAAENMTVVRWEFPASTTRTTMHAHPEHEQIGYVISGSLEMQVGDEIYTLHAGDMYRAPRNVPHGNALILSTAVVLDVFSPPRNDYVEPEA